MTKLSRKLTWGTGASAVAGVKAAPKIEPMITWLLTAKAGMPEEVAAPGAEIATIAIVWLGAPVSSGGGSRSTRRARLDP